MDLVFTVICREPLTKTEEKEARLGISPDPRPILERWGSRNGWNAEKVNKDVAYVEDPAGNFKDTGLTERQNAKVANKNRGHRRNPNPARKRAKRNARRR